MGTPIKPLNDTSKARTLASTKPSATVTPTFKSLITTSQSGVSSQSLGMRRAVNLNTTTSTKTVATCTTPNNSGNGNQLQTSVEKGEASSTTSSPKTEQQLLSAASNGNKAGKKESSGPQVSPVSSTHPDTAAGHRNISSPNSNEEDGGVSSTTRELDIKNNLMKEQQKAIMKEFIKKEVALKGVDKILSDKTDSLFSPATILQNNKVINKHDRSIKDNKGKITDSSAMKDGKRIKEGLSSHGKDRKSSSSSHHRGHDVHRKMKEIKDRELKDFLSATDTIPNHHIKKDSTKPRSKEDSKYGDRDNSKKDKDKRDKQDASKRRLSSQHSIASDHHNDDGQTKSKIPKIKSEHHSSLDSANEPPDPKKIENF